MGKDKEEGDDMQILNKEMTKRQSRPVKVLQFGEGNFLRAFVDYILIYVVWFGDNLDCIKLF